VSAAIFAEMTHELGIALVLLFAVLGAILGSTIGLWIGDRYPVGNHEVGVLSQQRR
jgi:membrane protein DedA with SNARE-associated domain